MFSFSPPTPPSLGNRGQLSRLRCKNEAERERVLNVLGRPFKGSFERDGTSCDLLLLATGLAGAGDVDAVRKLLDDAEVALHGDQSRGGA